MPPIPRGSISGDSLLEAGRMLVSYRWLKELIPRLDRDSDEVAEALSAIGLAVDGVTDHASALRSVVIAEVVKVAPHPQRDKLRLVTIRTDGDAPPPSTMSLPPRLLSEETVKELTVVCGAANVPSPGGLVVFAGLGVRLPGVDFVLERREIAGVESVGMLCSEAELGLAPDSDGILVFPPGAHAAGTRLIDALPEAREVVFELDVTPNRPDALGHVGVARDLAAFFELDFEPPSVLAAPEGGSASSAEVTVENLASDRCPKYGAAVVRQVKMSPSPDAMRYRLHRLGVRPISNVVDVTNWLMLEWGQPLHAFDLDAVHERKIVIRAAVDGEEMETLDGVRRALVGEDLVICDGRGPTALAGIMGGATSEISEKTTRVLIECAYFSPRGIRRTARRLGMHTESSHRFERGTDSGVTEVVLSKARRMLCDLAEGVAAPGTVRADGAPIDVPAIELRSDKVDKLLGVDVPFREATRLLGRLGLRVEFVSDVGRSGSIARVRGATHRPDISIEADLIEEIARIRGLDSIPTDLPSIAPQTPRSSGRLERRITQLSTELGLDEALTYSFVSPRDLEGLGVRPPVVRLKNPLSEERSVLRTSLLPGLLDALRRSRRRAERRVRLFTVGSIFLPVGSRRIQSSARPAQRPDLEGLPYEKPSWAAVLAGPRDEHLVGDPPDVDFYSAKAVIVGLVERFTGQPVELEYLKDLSKAPYLHPRGAVVVSVAGIPVGKFGPLHPDMIETFDLDGPLLVLEVDLDELEQIGSHTPKYRPLPKLPPVTRDLSLVVPDETLAKEVIDAIRRVAGPVCESVEVTSEFRGGSVPSGHRSLTFRVVYRDPLAQVGKEGGRTLTDVEVDTLQGAVVQKTAEQFGATLRG